MDNVTPQTVCQQCLECDKHRINNNPDGCMGRARAEDCPEKKTWITKEEAAAILCATTEIKLWNCKDCDDNGIECRVEEVFVRPVFERIKAFIVGARE